VTACPNCGFENPAEARFCMSCAAPLHAEVAREQRKVVTVLFCDLVGSTALGESVDPEALRARMSRYFDDLRVIIERHGGVVEKFVGDAVMAVFGIPAAHEDDAVRAVRAASEMRDAIGRHGLEARIGVNTGEVVVGGDSEDTLVTGDAVNVAARLEQAAPTGETLIGAETRLLVRDAVRLEPVEPLVLKGKSEPVEAYRLIEVLGDAAGLARHLETPLVGRARERRRLWRDYEDAVADSTCRLFTLLGPAGIGKSRLVADFLERVGDSAEVMRGRCLSYGEGITYWPLVEMLIAADVEPGSVIGTSPAETQLAFRRLLEERAALRPQVVVIDDLQWAEPVFVDLVEHVADLSRGAPIFLLCVARTELLDVRPDWGGGKVNATSLLLEPLDEQGCAELMERLASEAPLDTGLRDKIAVASGGNPLFVEEMLAMVREQGGAGEIAVPPTIHALLQARIDSLDGDVRMVMERGAVEGEVFHRGTVSELSPEPVRDGVEAHLATLVRKELIRSAPPMFPSDEGFRFRHLLIRDAAYEALPKATRAELHERFADWLSSHDLVERDEIVGYHLEQAHRYRSELDAADPVLPELARRASEHLGVSGRAALDRADYNAGRSLLRRAVAILPLGDDRRHVLAPDLAFALWESGELGEATVILAEARAARNPVAAAIATIVDNTIDYLTDGRTSPEERALQLEEARGVVEAADHAEGLALYWWSRAGEVWVRCRASEALSACEQGLRQAARSGRFGRTDDFIWLVRSAYVFGPTPVDEAIERVQELEAAAGSSGLLEAGAKTTLGRLYAMRGEVDRGRALHLEARDTYRAAGMAVSAASVAMHTAWIEQRAGDLEAWESATRAGLAELDTLNDRQYSVTMAVNLALCLHLQNRFAEVAALCARARAESPRDDLVNFVYADELEAAAFAHGGRHDEAATLLARALEAADSTDFVFVRAESRLVGAEVHALAGRDAEAAELARAGLGLLEAKGDVTAAAQWRRRLSEIDLVVA
jgi:class 3 adenylate cyclase/tetratricopeptide (TPR) repeat protein